MPLLSAAVSPDESRNPSGSASEILPGGRAYTDTKLSDQDHPKENLKEK